MLRDKKSGLVFKNRKEARQVMGTSRFFRLFEQGAFEFINDPEEKRKAVEEELEKFETEINKKHDFKDQLEDYHEQVEKIKKAQ